MDKRYFYDEEGTRDFLYVIEEGRIYLTPEKDEIWIVAPETNEFAKPDFEFDEGEGQSSIWNLIHSFSITEFIKLAKKIEIECK